MVNTPTTILTLLSGGASPASIALWGGLLVLLAIGGGVVWMHMRNRLLRSEDEAFSIRSLLNELEESRASGVMTEEEFQKARNAVLGLPPAEPHEGDSDEGEQP